MHIAAEQGGAKAPSAATYDLAIFLDQEMSLIGEQLAINTEGAPQCPFDLFRTVVFQAQSARGSSDQCIERGDIGDRGLTQGGGHAAESVALCRLVLTCESQDSGRIHVYTKPTEPRSIGGVLDDGLKLWRESLSKTWPLALLAQLVIAVPLVLLRYKMQGVVPGSANGPLSAVNAANAQAMLALVKSPTTWLAYVIILIFSLLCYTAIVVRIAAVADDAVSSLGGSLGSALRLMPRLLAQLLLFIVVFFIVAVALALLAGIGTAIAGGAKGLGPVLIFSIFFIGAAIVFGRVFLASIVLMLDDAGPAESIAISWRLTRGCWWRCSGILLVLIVIGLVFSLVIGFISAGISAAVGAPSLLGTGLSQLVSLLANAVLGSLYPAVLIAIFYDLKLRKQGSDLLGRVDSLARQ